MEKKEQFDRRDLVEGMNHMTKIIERIEDIQGQITDLILQQTGMRMDTVDSKKTTKYILVLAKYQGGRRMQLYGCRFQMQTFGSDMTLMNLITFITRWFFGDKEKGHPPNVFKDI